ncbi:MAG: ATP-binding protein [Candidatus Omnitrophota bacterium]
MIKRFILNKLQQEMTRPEINILLGPRQVGKTTLLYELEAFCRSQGLKTAFFDLEQPQILAGFNCSEAEIIQKLREAGQVVFIDEFQYIRNASKIFKAVYDSRSKVKLICSGSSSLAIHKHLKESLAGRRILFCIYPLQYAEIRASSKNNSVGDYLRFGGMPGLTQTGDDARKLTLLSELIGAYIQKDIKSLIKEENVRAFNHLLYLLAQDQGSLISVHSLSKEVNMSVKAVNRYLEIMEQTFVNYRIYSYSNNLGNELKKSCKTYLYDLGIRNLILKDTSAPEGRADLGVLYESFVFLRLQAGLAPNMEIKFWRTKDGAEVDFVLLRDRKPIPIEVKAGLQTNEVPSGLKRFLVRYPKTPLAYVVNGTHSGSLRYETTEIRYLTFEEFATTDL